MSCAKWRNRVLGDLKIVIFGLERPIFPQVFRRVLLHGKRRLGAQGEGRREWWRRSRRFRKIIIKIEHVSKAGAETQAVYRSVPPELKTHLRRPVKGSYLPARQAVVNEIGNAAVRRDVDGSAKHFVIKAARLAQWDLAENLAAVHRSGKITPARIVNSLRQQHIGARQIHVLNVIV